MDRSCRVSFHNHWQANDAVMQLDDVGWDIVFYFCILLRVLKTCAPDGAGRLQTRAPTCSPHKHPLWRSAYVYHLLAPSPPAGTVPAFGEVQDTVTEV